MMKAGFALTGRHVLFGMVGFFGIVTLVNVVMIWLALSSWPGLSGVGYRDAAAQRAMLAERDAIASLGWTADLSIAQQGSLSRLDVLLTDRQGMTVTGIALSADFRRNVVEALDRTVALVPGPQGAFSGDVSLPARGQWTLRLVATRDGKQLWVEDRTIWLN